MAECDVALGLHLHKRNQIMDLAALELSVVRCNEQKMFS
jgi:hypothetical protein